MTSPQLSGYASTDAYSLQPTPRASNFNEMEIVGGGTPVWGRSPVAGGRVLDGGMVVWESPEKWRGDGGHGCKDITMSGTYVLGYVSNNSKWCRQRQAC